MKRQIEAFDRHLTASIRRLPQWVRPYMKAVTLVGHPFFTLGTAALLAYIGIFATNPELARIGIIAAGTIAFDSVLKLLLRRPRPESDYVHTMLLKTFSFPSGHAAGSVVSYGALAFVFAGVGNVWAAGLSAAVALLCVLIGISRVYLGAHYPSDVVGGWLVGGIGLVIIVVTGG